MMLLVLFYVERRNFHLCIILGVMFYYEVQMVSLVFIFASVDVQLAIGTMVHTRITNIVQRRYTSSSAFKVCCSLATELL